MQFNVIPMTWPASERLTSHQHKQATLRQDSTSPLAGRAISRLLRQAGNWQWEYSFPFPAIPTWGRSNDVLCHLYY